MAEYTKGILRRDGKPDPDAIGRVHLHVEDFHSNRDPKQIRVDLYNYGIDGNVARPEHKAWAKTQLVPFVRGYRYHVKLFGKASKSGTEADNRRVATERVLLFKEFLVESCALMEPIVPGNEMQIHGSHGASATENGRDRAIHLLLSPGWKTLPNPPPPKPTPNRTIPTSDDFDDWMQFPPEYNPKLEPDKPRRKYQIRYLGGKGASFGFGAEIHRFEVRDAATGQTRKFKMKAYAIGIQAHYTPPPLDPSWSNEFTSNAQSLDEFNGRTAVLGSAGAGNWSVSGLAIIGCDRVEVDTGHGIGPSAAPVSANYGDFEYD